MAKTIDDMTKTIGEVIKELEEIKKKHGNLRMYVDYDDERVSFSIQVVEVTADYRQNWLDHFGFKVGDHYVVLEL